MNKHSSTGHFQRGPVSARTYLRIATQLSAEKKYQFARKTALSAIIQAEQEFSQLRDAAHKIISTCNHNLTHI